MPYITQAEIEAELPPEFILEALDDDGDGTADAGLFDKIEASAAEAIDARLGQRFEVPFTDTVPPMVKRAARVFVLETLYFRRGIDPNPWAKEAGDLRAKLDLIADGKEPLAPDLDRKNDAVTAITETAKTTDPNENLPT